jgi:ribosome biogenesis GTPase / thiamine phosphate phosphatase
MFESDLPKLRQLGLSPFLLQQLFVTPPEGDVGRVVCERRGEYEIVAARASLRASLSGRLAHELPDDDYPTVGDWVVVEPADPVGRIQRVLARQSVLRRVGVDGSSRAQNLAANVDLCCVVCALTAPEVDAHAARRALNPRRIERYLLTAESSRIPALVLINKADVLPDVDAEAARTELAQALPGARIVLVSAKTGRGLDQLNEELSAGSSAVLLGSSGVGKSTLVNALLGTEAQRVSAERAEDARGRHTTTERHLLELASGAFLIDTPGMRELALWADDETELTGGAFDEIERLAQACRFRDCRHQGEPGCAVQAALEAGELSSERLEHAHKLERELLHQRARVDVRLRTARHQANKARARASRVRMKEKGR